MNDNEIKEETGEEKEITPEVPTPEVPTETPVESEIADPTEESTSIEEDASI